MLSFTVDNNYWSGDIVGKSPFNLIFKFFLNFSKSNIAVHFSAYFA